MSPCNFGTYRLQAKMEGKATYTLQTCTLLFSKCLTWWPWGNLVGSAIFNLEKGNIFDSLFVQKYEIFSSI